MVSFETYPFNGLTGSTGKTTHVNGNFEVLPKIEVAAPRAPTHSRILLTAKTLAILGRTRGFTSH